MLTGQQQQKQNIIIYLHFLFFLSDSNTENERKML